jgi:glyoxylase-like metal-dependent hydrolase (beta-lactamase superfamily II)
VSSLEPIDLLHTGVPKAVGCYALETVDGPAIFDCGPLTTLPQLEEALEARGLALEDLRHVLLSHIHLDHAGAIGTIVRRNARLQVHVSAVGAPHLVDPSRLERSARRLYLDMYDVLWGEMVPVPEENIHVVGERVLEMDCFPAPGHATHHVCYLDADGTLWSGDAAGVRILPERYVVPPTPPPDIDVDAWLATIAEIERRAPARLALIHFGIAEDVGDHLAELRARLEAWAALVAGGATLEEFEAAIRVEHEQAHVEQGDAYGHGLPAATLYAGLARWAEKRGEAAA